MMKMLELHNYNLIKKGYQYFFKATDLFDNTITSDIATFEMTKSSDELLESPLVTVTNIESYNLPDTVLEY